MQHKSLMSEEEFLKHRKEGWKEVRKINEAKGMRYTKADDYFDEYFGTPQFDRNTFLSIRKQYGIAYDNEK